MNTYELIYLAGTWPDVQREALHTRSHAAHPLWTQSPHRVLTTAEANLRNDSRCYCLAKFGPGELP